MNKLTTLFIIFLVSFCFTTDSYAIILENLPTKTDSVQPIPKSIISNMVQNFDMSVYKENYYKKGIREVSSTNELSSSSSESNVNPNSSIDKNMNYTFWYWLIASTIIISAIIYWSFKKLKK